MGKIAVIGGKNSGKTIFLNTIAFKLHHCKKRSDILGDKFSDIRVVKFSDTVINSLNHGVWPPENPDFDKMALVELEFKKDGYPLLDSSREFLSFMDYPGEYFNEMIKEGRLGKQAKKTIDDLKKASAYIVLLSVDEINCSQPKNSDSMDYVNYYCEVFKTITNTKIGRIGRTKKPCLVLLNKSDKLRGKTVDQYYDFGDDVEEYAKNNFTSFYSRLTAYFDEKKLFWAYHTNIKEINLHTNGGTRPDFNFLKNVDDEKYLYSIAHIIKHALKLHEDESFFAKFKRAFGF